MFYPLWGISGVMVFITYNFSVSSSIFPVTVWLRKFSKFSSYDYYIFVFLMPPCLIFIIIHLPELIFSSKFLHSAVTLCNLLSKTQTITEKYWIVQQGSTSDPSIWEVTLIAMMKKVVRASETLVSFHNIPEDCCLCACLWEPEISPSNNYFNFL